MEPAFLTKRNLANVATPFLPLFYAGVSKKHLGRNGKLKQIYKIYVRVSLFFTCRLRANWNQEGNLRRTRRIQGKAPLQVRRAPELKRGAGNNL